MLSSNESRTGIGIQHLFTFVSCIPAKYKNVLTAKRLHSYDFKLAAKHLYILHKKLQCRKYLISEEG
jgi:hypothetical protein